MFKDTPSSAKMAGLLVLGALATLIVLHKGFVGVDVAI